jgi:hypothetical protein
MPSSGAGSAEVRVFCVPLRLFLAIPSHIRVHSSAGGASFDVCHYGGTLLQALDDAGGISLR